MHTRQRAVEVQPIADSQPLGAVHPHHRTPGRDYQWTGPQGQTYLVTPTGTIPIPPN